MQLADSRDTSLKGKILYKSCGSGYSGDVFRPHTESIGRPAAQADNATDISTLVPGICGHLSPSFSKKCMLA